MIEAGDKCQHGVREVIVLKIDGDKARVQAIDTGHPAGLGRPFNTATCYLTPLGMKYLGGALPGAKA
jgi:hypothetical protein